MSAWRRDEQLSLTLAPARAGQKNTYPPDAFRGALEEAPKRSGRGTDEDGGAKPTWVGDIAGDERSYSVRAFPKEGKSGPYLTLYFEVIEQKGG